MVIIKHNRATLVELLIAILGIPGLTVTDRLLPNLEWKYKLVASIVLFGVFGLFVIGRDKRILTFKPDSKQLEDFFAKWYAADGHLSIYCNDLNWVSRDVNKALTLKATDKQLSLYLSEIGEKGEHLRKHGAKVFQIGLHGATPSHKFSILRMEDGSERMICRSKFMESEDTGKELIEFISTSKSRDPHLVALAKDVLSSCEKI